MNVLESNNPCIRQGIGGRVDSGGSMSDLDQIFGFNLNSGQAVSRHAIKKI